MLLKKKKDPTGLLPGKIGVLFEGTLLRRSIGYLDFVIMVLTFPAMVLVTSKITCFSSSKVDRKHRWSYFEKGLYEKVYILRLPWYLLTPCPGETSCIQMIHPNFYMKFVILYKRRFP